jgi:hypothetical protein
MKGLNKALEPSRLTPDVRQKSTMRIVGICLIASLALRLAASDSGLSFFEPRYGDCFKWSDKFAHPQERVAPAYVYPHEKRHAGIVGEVVALIELAADGTPSKISVLYDTDAPDGSFSSSVVAGLRGARWESQKKPGVWFYYKVNFELIPLGDTIPGKPGVVYDFPCSESGCDHPRTSAKEPIQPQAATGSTSSRGDSTRPTHGGD